jgi:hypothetical protein
MSIAGGTEMGPPTRRWDKTESRLNSQTDPDWCALKGDKNSVQDGERKPKCLTTVGLKFCIDIALTVKGKRKADAI